MTIMAATEQSLSKLAQAIEDLVLDWEEVSGAEITDIHVDRVKPKISGLGNSNTKNPLSC